MRNLIVFLILLAGCSLESTKPKETQWQSGFSYQVDRARLETLPLKAKNAVRSFYAARNFQMLWSTLDSITVSRDSMVQIINQCDRWGMNPDHYHRERVNRLTGQAKTSESIGELDAYLTDAFFLIYQHLHHGRIDLKTGRKLNVDSAINETAFADLELAVAQAALEKKLKRRQPGISKYREIQNFLTNLAVINADSVLNEKIQKLHVTLERWRQHEQYPKRYIRVNIPSYYLEVVEDDYVVLRTKVIIGKAATPTPVLRSVIRSFIIYPYWHVPRSIVKELLPNIQKDTNYLKRHNYEVLGINGNELKASTIDWPSLSGENFPYTLRQREGNENTMGMIKFNFANNYNVYLHDTNARRLFSRSNRALSHGCVRVNKAVELAQYLIKDDYVVSPEDLEQYLQMQHRMEIKLIKPIPVYLEYFTADVVDGKVELYDDLYKKDSVVWSGIYGVPADPPDGL